MNVLAEEIVTRGLNVREVEALVNDMQQGPRAGEGGGSVTLKGLGSGGGTGSSSHPLAQKDPDTAAFEKDLSDALGLRVEVRRGAGETGYLTIQYRQLRAARPHPQPVGRQVKVELTLDGTGNKAVWQ